MSVVVLLGTLKIEMALKSTPAALSVVAIR